MEFMEFLFEVGKRVKVQDTGEVGIVKHRDTDSTLGLPYYEVEFNDRIQKIAQKDLLPA
ncbi:MAG: hypothetical protein WCD49_14515 [Candidatus Acidiferrales bacterium]